MYGGRLCGTSPPFEQYEPIHSSSNSFHITFVSDDEPTEHLGLLFAVTFEEQECRFVLTSESGIIASPNYPNRYGSNENCLWNVSPASGLPIHIDISNFEVSFAFTHKAPNISHERISQ
jgi:hypothetical protein